MEVTVSRVFRCTNKLECGIILQIAHTPIVDPEYQYLQTCPVCDGSLDYAYKEQREAFEEAIEKKK